MDARPDPAGPRDDTRNRGTALRLGLALVAVALYAAAVLPLAVRFGAAAEEIAGLVPVPVERLYAQGAGDRTRTIAGVRVVESVWMPVWGVELGSGRYLPLHVDAHKGVVAYYPARLTAWLGGLTGGRAFSVGTGLLALLCTFLLTRRVAGEAAAWIATLLLAGAPIFAFIHFWCHTPEQWDTLSHVMALLAVARLAETRRFRWAWAAAFLLGLGLASKTTAVWNLVAMVLVALLYRWRPPALRPRQWLACAAGFVLPLLPQLSYLLLGQAGGLTRRLQNANVPGGGSFVSLERLAFFSRHFVDAFAGLGTYMAPYVQAGSAGPARPGMTLRVLLVGLLIAAAVAGLVVAAGSRRAARPARMLGAGLGALLLQYVLFYYVGMTLYLLVVPWIAMALGVTGAAAWRYAAGRARRPLRVGLQVALVAAAAGLVANNAVEAVTLNRAVARPGYAIFDRGAQERLARLLVDRRIDRPYTTTYGLAGVLEFFSHGAVRPRHAFPIFEHVACGGRGREDARTHGAAWDVLLGRLEPGRHHLVLTPTPSRVDVSPCSRGALIAGTLEAAAARRHGTLRPVERVTSPTAGVAYEIVELELPAPATQPRRADAPDG
jgi:4-amino-4-deoxy-L-arabinose transferase-like glycosyltransferase